MSKNATFQHRKQYEAILVISHIAYIGSIRSETIGDKLYYKINVGFTGGQIQTVHFLHERDAEEFWDCLSFAISEWYRED